MEVQLYTNDSKSSNPFSTNVEKDLIQTPPTNTPDPTEIQVNTKHYTPIQIINEPPLNKNNECNLKIRVNIKNNIIHTNRDELTTTIDDEVSNFKLDTKVQYKGTKATIVEISPLRRMNSGNQST